MATIKLAEYTFDNTVGDVLPSLTPSTISMTNSDTVDGNITTRIVYIDDATMPTGISFGGITALKTIEYLNLSSTKSVSFKGCTSLISVNFSNQTAPNLTSLASVFYNTYNLQTLDLTNFVAPNVSSMVQCFQNSGVKNIITTGTKISGLKEMHFAFLCSGITDIDLTGFDVSQVTSFERTFSECYSLININISNWNTKNATSMNGMFSHCRALTSLDVSSFNTSNITNMSNMFQNCSSLKLLDISNFDTSNSSLSLAFQNCKLEQIGMVYSDSTTINKVAENLYTTSNCDIYYLDANPSELKPVSNVTYVQYQENNLYLPPSLTLRSNGDVRDEYNPFTSQFTQRIGEDGSVLSSPVTTTVKSIVAYNDTVKYGYELPNKTTDLFHPEAQKYEQVIDLGTLNGTENWTKVNQYVFTVPFTNAKANTSTDVLTQKDQVESVSIDGSTLTLTFKSDSYVGGNNIAVNALKIWLQSNNVQFKYELKNHILTDMTLEEFDFENAHFVKPQAYKNGVVTQSNKDNLIFASMTYQTKSDNRYELPLLESNSEYTLRYEGSANQVTLGGSTNSSIETNCLVQSGSANKVALFNDEVSNVMLIKGDVREQTFPYFKGLLSTQMPVLTTCGKNLFDRIVIENQYVKQINFEDRECVEITTRGTSESIFEFSNLISLHDNIVLSCDMKCNSYALLKPIYEDDVVGDNIGDWSRLENWTSKSFIIPKSYKKLKGFTLYSASNTNICYIDLNSFQIEQSSIATTYEPHKSNILSCNEEVTLHSIGDVCDTLDCKTGELCKYYEEFTLDGSEKFEWHGIQDDGTYGFNISKNEVYKKLDNYIDPYKPSICNSLEYRGTTMYGKSGEGFAISNADHAYIQLVVSLDKLLSPTIDGVRKYLSENPLHFIVPLLNKSIKTVNLSIVDQDNQPIEQMNYFTDYYGEIKSDGTLPRLTYKLQSTNTFAVPQLKPNTLYTMYSEGEATVATLGGKASILLQNPQTVTSGSANKSLTFDSATSRVILIESDVRNQVIPYFTGTLDVINPIIKTTAGNKSNTVNTNVKLRSVGDVRDSYDLKTGILTKRISDDHTILDNPQTQTISVTKPVSYNGATVELSSNTTSLLPYFEYSCKSPNYYQAPIESGEIYTVKFNKTSNGTLTMGGVTANTTGNQVITTKNSDVKAILFSGDLGISDLMIMKTDVRNVPTPYFRGLKDVVNPTITVSDGNRTSNSVSITATMRSLPNGTKDELNLVTGEFVQRVGQRNYEDGDSNGPSMITDGTTTLYQLPTVKRSNLSLSWSNGVLTAYDGSTIITSEAQLLKPHLYFRIPTSTLEELVSILEEKNADLASQMVDLEVENLMTMVALAEVYEIMMNVSMATSSTASNTKDILMTPMVGVYAKLVTAGVKTIDEVPEHLQINVTKLLKK